MAIAQGIGSLHGLDHTFHCPDVMTYLSGCGDKTLVDQDVSCGEFQSRSCQCTAMQNSHGLLLKRIGARP